MTDFDQIIKEKIGQKEYSYSASSWHRFAKKSGLKSALTTTQSTLIAVASVAIIAVGSWLGIRHFSSMKPTTVPSVQQMAVEEPVLAAADTVEVEVMPEEPTDEVVMAVQSPKPVTPKVTTEAPKAEAIDTVGEEKPARKPILRPKNPRRILEIDPDTIKSNE